MFRTVTCEVCGKVMQVNVGESVWKRVVKIVCAKCAPDTDDTTLVNHGNGLYYANIKHEEEKDGKRIIIN
jgi:hypothetical protein